MPGIVQGAILNKYRALGGERSFLGQAVTNELPTPDRSGRYNHFQGGSIYWTQQTGAWEVHGAIKQKWAALGWERSVLRYPVTDERTTPDGRGRYNHFQGGSIYWTQQTGACEVHGGIKEKWAALGWERSFLGYPVTDERVTPDGIGRYNHFQGGSIYWTQQTGAHEVHGAIKDKWASLGWERSYLGYPISDEQVTPDGRGRVSHFQGGSIYWYPDRGAYDVKKGSTGGSNGSGGIAGLPDLSGTWRPRFYGSNGTITITKTPNGYTAVGVDGIRKYITREGNTLWLRWSANGRNSAVHCGIEYVKSNQISWAFPPPDRTSYDTWNRV